MASIVGRERDEERWKPRRGKLLYTWYVLQGVKYVAWRVFFGAAVITIRSKIGRYATLAVLLWMLLDLSWGNDPALGPGATFLLAATLFGVGLWSWPNQNVWEETCTRAYLGMMPGSTRAEPPKVSFGVGRYTDAPEHKVRISDKMLPEDVAVTEQGLRHKLPAAEGWSWRWDWDFRRWVCRAFMVPDLPPLVGRREPSPTPERVAMGVGLNGELVWELDNNYGCLLVCGNPGGGKSVVLTNIVKHCLEHPDDFWVFGCDMKGGVELGGLERYRDVRKVGDSLDSCLTILTYLREEVDRRTPMLRAAGVKKISKLNEVREARGEAPLKRVVLLVDELAELTDIPEVRDSANKEVYEKRGQCKGLIDSLVRLGRAVGVHLVLATQRPDAKYMGGAARSNIQARIATGRLNRQGCEMMESKLAASLPGEPGRGVWWRGGQEEELQLYMVEDEELDEVAFGGVR